MKQFSIPTGMRDQILGECEIKKQLQLKIESCLDRWGYKEVITPTIEYYKTYEQGFEDINEQDMYKFFDAQGRILMLRADMTIPIARVVATKFKEAKVPLRFRYCANVYKVVEELSGMRSETSECGVELIGIEETCGDLEIISTALETLKVIGNKKWVLEIGNISFFNKACELSGVKEEDQSKLAILINTKQIKDLDNLLEVMDIKENAKALFRKLPWLSGNADILEKAKSYIFDAQLALILDYMKQLNEDLLSLGYQNVQYDLGKTSNLNYYTGIIFEAFVEGVGKRVLTGGRYDRLISQFGRNIPATGFAIKLDSLLDVVDTQEKQKQYTIKFHPKLRVEALKKAKELQKECRVNLCVDNTQIYMSITKEE